MTIKYKNITHTNFARFGQLVKTPNTRPTAKSIDYKYWSDLAHYAIQGETEVGVCCVFRQPQAIVTGMERHVNTPEILIPIDAPFIAPLLVEGDGESQAQAFMVQPGQAVVINAGVWHGACLPVAEHQSSYFVIFKRNTPFKDVYKKEIKPFVINVPY
jgi:ureidoglycolate hydrolase